jgi:predicted DNA-binding transcriptional regulator AlpA
VSVIVEGEKYLFLDELLKKIEISQSLLYVKMKYGNFPKPTKLRIWKESEIDEYLERTRGG